MSKWDRAIEQICEGVKPTMRSKNMSKWVKVPSKWLMVGSKDGHPHL